MRIRMWLDCEFNGFGGELISMALVCEDGTEWYQCLDCTNPTPFVAAHVLPVLNKEPVSSKLVMSISLESYLRRYDTVAIVADWPEDLKHFFDVMTFGDTGLKINSPAKLTAMLLCRSMSLADVVSKVPHNALEDARALMQSCKEGQAWRGL